MKHSDSKPKVVKSKKDSKPKNSVKTSKTSGKNSNEKFYFDCPKCIHEFPLSKLEMINGSGCPFCENTKLCDNLDCKLCYENSLASLPLAKFWSKKNKKSPREILKNLNESVDDDIYINKTEQKLFEELRNVYPGIQRQFKPEWCKNPETGRHLPFDFCIPEHNIIIELDGPQHFEQVSNWKSPIEQQKRDLEKQKCANVNNYYVIRLLQKCVYKDFNYWKNRLIETIEKVKIEPDNWCIPYKDEYDTFINLFESIIDTPQT
jgi:very-short-patch-repair endonuclease